LVELVTCRPGAGAERGAEAEAAPAAAAPRARRKKRRAAAAAVQEVPAERPGALRTPHLPMEGLRMGLLGVAAFAALGGAFVLGRRLLDKQLPKVQKARARQWHAPGPQRLSCYRQFFSLSLLDDASA